MRAVTVRVVAAIGVVVLCTVGVWLLLHSLRPEAFPGEGALLPGLWRYLREAFLHFDLGESRVAEHGPSPMSSAKGIPADIQLLLGGVAVGLTAGIAGGVYCGGTPG